MWLIKPKNNYDINGFIHKYPRINVSASCSTVRGYDSETGRNFPCDAPITVSSTDIWYSNNDNYNSYTVSFNDFSIYLNYYSVKVGEDQAFPKQWILERIDANNNPTTLSTVHESQLNTNWAVKTFKNEGPKGPFKQFKFTSTGLNYIPTSNEAYNKYHLSFYLYKVDFFGYATILSNIYESKFSLKLSNLFFIFILVLFPIK